MLKHCNYYNTTPVLFILLEYIKIDTHIYIYCTTISCFFLKISKYLEKLDGTIQLAFSHKA